MKKTWKKTAAVLTAAAAAFALYGCSGSGSADTANKGSESAGAEKSAEEPTVVEIGVVGEYNAQWDTVNELLAPENIQVKLVKFTDYAAPNRALSDGEIDLNAFQTKTYLTKYNVQIEIMEAESATLANILPDCAAAIINGGNAYTAGLNPTTDSIFTEDVNPDTNTQVPELVNVIAARTEDKDNEVYKKIVEAYQSPEVEKTIEEAYQGAFLCAWEGAGEADAPESEGAESPETEAEAE